MSYKNTPKPQVGVPYRTRNEELTGQDAKLKRYLAAVLQAGAEPVPISLGLSKSEVLQLAQTLDGVVLSGSPADVDPSRFNAPRRPESADPDPDRERVDFALLEHALAEHKPVLGICYGIQSLNIFLGGTLIQDIPAELHSKIEHDWDRENGAPEPFHPAHFESGSQLAEMAGAREAVVNSSHHQSILEPGRDLRITGRTADGVVEAVEWTGDSNWIMGVQWHPERMAETDALAQSLFRGLVDAAAARKTLARI
jgi:putative glutamine amidotransferase